MEELFEAYDRLDEEARAALNRIKAVGLEVECESLNKYMMAAINVINNQQLAFIRIEKKLDSLTRDEYLFDEILAIVKLEAQSRYGKTGGEKGVQYGDYREIVVEIILNHTGDLSKRGVKARIVEEANTKIKVLPSERRAWQIVQEEVEKAKSKST